MDDSFKKPGAVPFKWEIRPGVPKLHQQYHNSPLQPQKHLSPPPLVSPSSPSFITTSSRRHPTIPSPTSSPSVFLPPHLQTRTSSFRSTPSQRLRKEPRKQPEVVAPAGCSVNLPSLPKLLLGRRGKKSSSKKKRTNTTEEEEEDRDHDYDGLETLSRWSVSSRRSVSPLYMDSPASPYSYSSSSPRPPPTGDVQWAGFALF
ncbi:hypothetical protein LINGRAPRIM_LOCUS2635 [Linum grandiflorum]